MKIKKVFLAILLGLAILPASVLADVVDVKNESEFKEAILNGNDIKLADNIKITDNIIVDKKSKIKEIIEKFKYPVIIKPANGGSSIGINIAHNTKELNKLEQKYANRTDNEAMMQKSQEMMLIYRKYNINPASSCLTSLIQLPLLFAFLEAINRVPAIFEGTLWNMNLGMTPSKALASGNYIYLILLAIIAFSTFFSFKQAMASQPQDGNSDMMRQTKTMTYIMTFMILMTSLSLPTALALYWIVNNVFGIVQNFVIKKMKETK